MNAFTDIHFGGVSGRKPAAEVLYRDTYWGYVILCDTPSARRARSVEVISMITGFALIASAVMQWIAPGALTSPDLVTFKAGASVTFVVLGGVLVWFARRGLRYEVQIDRNKREVRAVLRNRRNLSRVIERVGFEDVGSAFIERARSPFAPSRLYMRVRDTQTLIEVATGPEAELQALHARLSHDLAAPRAVKANAPQPVVPRRPVSTLRARQAISKNKSLFRAVR